MKNFQIKHLVPYVVAILVFIGISLAYFNPVLDGKKLKQSDIIHYKGSSQEITDFRDQTGEEALWTNSMFGGMPAYQISVYFYKTNLVWYINQAIQMKMPHPVNILLVLFIGFFILLLTLKVDPWLSIAGSIPFAFSSYYMVILAVGHNAQTLAIGYMPAVLAATILIFRGKYLLGGALLALFMALEISVNHVQMTYYLLMILGVYGLFEFIWAIIEKKYMHFTKALGVIFIAAILSIGPNIANLWTSYEYMKYTIRGKSELTSDQQNKSDGLDKDYITQWSYGVGETFTLLIPDTKGGSSGALGNNKSAMDGVDKRYKEAVAQSNQYWGNMPFTQGTAYAGALVVFLFVFGMFFIRNKLKWPLLAVSILAILLSWGHNLMWLTDFFIDYVPFYNKFRAVSFMIVIVEFTLPLIAILAIKELVNDPTQLRTDEKMKKRFKRAFYYSTGIVGGILLIFLVMPKVFFNFLSTEEMRQFDQFRQQQGGAQVDQFVAALEYARLYIFRMSALRSLVFVIIGAGLIFLFARMKKMSKYVVYAAIGILFLIDLVPIDLRVLSKKDFVAKKQVETPFTMSKCDEAILKDEALDYRVLNLATDNFTTDAATSYFHKSIGGYHAAKLRRYQELIEHRLLRENEYLIKVLSEAKPDSVIIATMYSLTSLNMLNTRYYIYNHNAPPMKNPAALGNVWFVSETKLVANADEEIKALDSFYPTKTAIVDKRFEQMLAGFKGEKDPASTISLLSYAPNKLVYEAKGLKQNQLAVFSEIYYEKGWNAYVDGQPADYFRTNYVLRGMVIPAGDHNIEFRFEPESYYSGSKISLASSLVLIILLAGALAFEIYRSIRKKETA